MKRIDTSTLELDQNTLQYAADDLWQELNGIESCYPQVLNDSDYNRIKAGVIKGSHAVPKQEELETLYLELISCLERISTEPTNIVSLAARRGRVRSLSDYLPKTFKDFVDKVTEAKLQDEYYKNAYDGAAEALFMREIEGGIDAVVPRHREEIKGRIYEILLENTSDSKDVTEIDNAGVDQILQLMGIEDEWALMGAGIDQGYRRIAELILFIRSEIDTEYIDSDKDELKLGRVNPEEFEALGTGMQKLFLAMGQYRSRYGSAKELKKAHRMEFARRVIMPQLKAVEDRRPSVMDAQSHGLTPLEINMLLMRGYIKIPSDDEPLGQHSPAANDPETGRTLVEIEGAALARIPLACGNPRDSN